MIKTPVVILHRYPFSESSFIVKALSPEWFGAQKPGAVDAAGGNVGTGAVDFRTASRAELAAAAREYGVKL
jgi:hypothetical protein